MEWERGASRRDRARRALGGCGRACSLHRPAACALAQQTLAAQQMKTRTVQLTVLALVTAFHRLSIVPQTSTSEHHTCLTAPCNKHRHDMRALALTYALDGSL